MTNKTAATFAYDSSFIIRIQLFQQTYHLQCRLRTLYSFVADRLFYVANNGFVRYVAAGPLDGLFDSIASEHAEQDRNAMPQTGLHNSQTDGAVNVLIVRSVAANDRS